MQYLRMIILSCLYKTISAISACLLYSTSGLAQFGYWGGSPTIFSNNCFVGAGAINISYVELQLASTKIDYNSLSNLPKLQSQSDLGLIALILAVVNLVFLIALAIYVKFKLSKK